MEKSKKGLNSFLLILTALIWGIAFVAQSKGGDAVGPYTFGAIRYIIGGFALIPVIKLLEKTGLAPQKPDTRREKNLLIKAGISCGICLGFASIFQQLGINSGTAAGKAGFLTACYIIIVPILSILLKKRCPVTVWIAVVITLFGLYLLCINGKFAVQKSDVLVLICALIFACHILTIDYFLEKGANAVRMACVQFFVASFIAAVPMFFIEMNHSFSAFPNVLHLAFGKNAVISILYAGVMSSGVGYTLQIVGQRGVNPTVASLLMSLESVFSVLAGWVILNESLSFKEIMGCVLIFAAIVLAQLPDKKIKNRE